MSTVDDEPSRPKYPGITVRNTNLDMLPGQVRLALRNATIRRQIPAGEADLFLEQVTSAPGRDNPLGVCQQWVTVE